MPGVSLRWREATEEALYGTHGFYRRERPSAHFRTSVHASPRYAEALLRLLVDVDIALNRPARLDVVDVGAGSGELLVALVEAAPARLRARLCPVAVERAARPVTLPWAIGWTDAPPRSVSGMIIANEWLDNVPVEVVEQTAGGPRVLLVEPATGDERPGPVPGAADLAWLDDWWPLRAVGERAEIGRPRDEAWAQVLGRLGRGLAVGIDYAHQRSARPPFGTMAGYRNGRLVRPVPDGSCDVTAHVALDSCAAAGCRAGARDTVLTTQRAALRALGLLGLRPPPGADPAGHLAALARAGAEGELTDPGGLGGFGWLVQSVGMAVPSVLRRGPRR